MAKDNSTKEKKDSLEATMQALLKKVQKEKERQDWKKQQANIRQFIYNLRFINKIINKAYGSGYIVIEDTIASVFEGDERALKYALSFNKKSTHTWTFQAFRANNVNGVLWIRAEFSETPVKKEAKA